MIIVAIPKSASTSLMKTLGELHNLPYRQILLKEFPFPLETILLHTYHSDMREIPESSYKDLIASSFGSNNEIFKQHIPPTKNNLNLLSKVNKVILLRKPDEIIEAYYRAEKKKIHSARKEFQYCATLEDWKAAAHNNGLHSDLTWFCNKWRKESDENPQFNLLINYSDLISNPQETVNLIEKHFDLPISSKVTLSKERYSRFFFRSIPAIPKAKNMSLKIINKIRNQAK